MSQEKQVLNGMNSTYLPDTPVTISGREYALLRGSIELFLAQAEVPVYVKRFKYFDNRIKDYIPESEVTELDLNNGDVKVVLDMEATFNPKNKVDAIDANFANDITLEAYGALMEKLEVDAKLGKTVALTEIQKMYDPNYQSNEQNITVSAGK